MTSEKLEYDSAIGGKVIIPDSIHTYQYAAQHCDEIRQLINEIQNPNSTKLAFQTLPKHMRRRAMSHHPKRLPRRYRRIHESQMAKAGTPKQGKRPSRKFRRKPSNLLKEYARRQQKNVWLETHIWHAKRFHMAAKWGYKLPVSSCAKTFRACYRASSEHCLLQDISYFSCVEVKGPIDALKTGFDRLTSSQCGLRITAKFYTSGQREGSVHLFSNDAYPKKALGKVTFMWRPVECLLEASRTVWLFVHPAVHLQVMKELIYVFGVTSDQTKVMETGGGEEARTETTTVAYTRCPRYSNADSSVSLTQLKDTLNRFRLTGPLSQSVLAKALKCRQGKTNFTWFKERHKDEAHCQQREFWGKCEGITSPAMFAANMILALNVEDPRIHRPKKRTKALPLPEGMDQDLLTNLPDRLSHSPLWDADIRTEVTRSMMSNHDLCTRRSQDVIVPGERCAFEDALQPVPLLLIQRPGSQDNGYKKLGYGCGWDVIVPSGYGMPVWLSLIMWGARPGGLREMNSIAKESGNDEYLPDTQVARIESSEKCRELQDRYFKLPPNKRVNYRKLGIASPFQLPFVKLLDEWKTVATNRIDDFHVIRDQRLLETISKALHRGQKLPQLSDDSLVPVHLKMKSRGNPGDCSIICLPKVRDLKRSLKQQKKLNNSPVHVEPLQEDSNENLRKSLRKQHKRILKTMRNRRVRLKKKLQETSEKRVKIQPPITSNLVDENFRKMCKLWLPDENTSIRKQCTREVFGYVTQSSFCFTEATVTAVGYVTGVGLKQLLSVCKGRGERMVLIRGTKSRNYRFAYVKVNCWDY